MLGLFVLMANIVGFLCGFIFLDLSPQQNTDRSIRVITRQSVSPATRLGEKHRPESDQSPITTTSPSRSSLNRPAASQTVLSEIMTTSLALPWAQHSSTRGPRRTGLRPPFAPCLYKKGRDSEDGIWQDFSVDDTLRFYAYSAFVDDRPTIGSDPVVRIIALATKLENDDLSGVGKTLYCVFHHETMNSEKQAPVMVQVASAAGPIGFGVEMDAGVKLKEYIFTCPLGHWQNPIPFAVTILGRPDRLSAVTSCIPIEVPPKPPMRKDFAVCVQVSYGQLDPRRLIEWFELQRLLGVSRVGVYDLSIDPGPGLEVLRHYAREGLVELRKTDSLPVPGGSQYLLHGSPVINDCLYRNMHSFNWILVIDLDEVLVPRNYSTLVELAAHLNRTYYPSPANFLFLNQYFFLDSDPDFQESTDYTILRYRHKAPLSPNGYAMKGYVDPHGCVQMHNHYCMGVAEAFKTRHHYEFVDSSLATSHHYKTCHLSPAECQKMLTQTTLDDVMMTYKSALKTSVENKIRDVFR